MENQLFSHFNVLLILKELKSSLSSNQINDQQVSILATVVADTVDTNCTDVDILMHCALCIGRFRKLLEKDLDKYKNTNTYTIFGLICERFEVYIRDLYSDQNAGIVLALLNS